jgi:hypothetical protein
MKLLPKPVTHRGTLLLAAHLESLDPEAAPARERLVLQLGSDLARKLVFALGQHHPARRAA